MTVGLRDFREPRHQALRWMLANPLLASGEAPQAAPPALR
jgi:hypothetical protein